MKKLSAILICFLIIFTCGFAGCASFSIDKVKYYNEVVAKVGDTHITRYELLSAYNSYGSSYFLNEDKKESEAIKETLDMLIDRESLYQYAVKHNDLYKPTEYQVNEMVKSVYESLDSQMESYIKTSKAILNIESDEEIKEEETKDEEEKAYLYSNYIYKKRAKVENNKIVYITEDEETVVDALIAEKYLLDHTLDGIVEEIKNNYFKENGWFDKYLEENEDSKYRKDLKEKSIRLMAEDLMEYEYYLRDENGKPYSKNTDDLIYRYVERNFTNQVKSQYLTNIGNYYLEHEELNIELLIEEYKYLSKVSYELYNDESEAEDYKTKIKDIGTKGDSILQHPELKDGTQFGYFIHTLINFDDTQKEEIKSLNANFKGSEEEKNAEIAKIAGKSKVQARNSETGKIDEDAEYVTLSNIVEEYNKITGTYEQKLAKFIEFMFKYTGDTGTLDAGMPYVIGYTPSEYTGIVNDEDKLDGTHSAMVTNFTKEAINLMKTGNKGAMSKVSIDNIGEMCITEYGIHFLFYVENVNAYDVDYSDVDSTYIQSENKTDLEHLNLYNKVLNPLTGKTYFDMLFDAVYPASNGQVFTSNTGYDKEEKRIIAEIQNTDGHRVTKYTTRIKATKTKI